MSVIQGLAEAVRRVEVEKVEKEKMEKEEMEAEEKEKIEEDEEEEEEVRVGWWKCRGPCGRELEMNADNFMRNGSSKTGLSSKCKACYREKVVAGPEGFKVCGGGCGEVLEENEKNFYHSPASKTGFTKYCKWCYDAHYGKNDIPAGHKKCTEHFIDAHYGKNDIPAGHKKCTGECGRVLEVNAENFTRDKSKSSGFRSVCKMCRSAKERARQAAKKRARVEPEQAGEAHEARVVHMPFGLVRVDDLPRFDDDEEGVISD